MDWLQMTGICSFATPGVTGPAGRDRACSGALVPGTGLFRGQYTERRVANRGCGHRLGYPAFGLGPGGAGRSVRPVIDWRRSTKTSLPSGRPVRVCRRIVSQVGSSGPD